MRTRIAVLFASGWLAAGGAPAWFVEGHRRVAIDAVRLLPASVPGFFREGGEAVGEGAVDPDVWKAPEAPALRDRESPEHFFDWEELEGRALPELRSHYVRLMASSRQDPAAVGYLPYAVLEDAERLAVAFAEHRRWPANPEIHGKILLYAGLLAHYAADICQPLHTTIHHDGRARADGSSPHTGIHQHVDALLESVPFDRVAAVAGLEISAVSDLRARVLEELAASHRWVEEVYAREASLAPRSAGSPWHASAVDFTTERYRAAVRFLATLYLTSWERSAAIELPRWLRRPER
jgi:hypothetical protein